MSGSRKPPAELDVRGGNAWRAKFERAGGKRQMSWMSEAGTAWRAKFELWELYSPAPLMCQRRRATLDSWCVGFTALLLPPKLGLLWSSTGPQPPFWGTRPFQRTPHLGESWKGRDNPPPRNVLGTLCRCRHSPGIKPSRGKPPLGDLWKGRTAPDQRRCLDVRCQCRHFPGIALSGENPSRGFVEGAGYPATPNVLVRALGAAAATPRVALDNARCLGISGTSGSGG